MLLKQKNSVFTYLISEIRSHYIVLKFSNIPQIYAFCTSLEAVSKIKEDLEGLNLRAGIIIGGILRADAMAKYLKKR